RSPPGFRALPQSQSRERGISSQIKEAGIGVPPSILAKLLKQNVFLARLPTESSQVPIRRGECSFRRAAMTERAVIRPVLGFSEGAFSMDKWKFAESLCTSIIWQFRSMAGASQIAMVVRSGPIPARERAAATLTLAGNPAAASRALPEKTRLASFNPSTEMSWAKRYGAPAKPSAGLRVTMRTD